MIRAYPRFPTLFPGETLVLHVSTTSPRFRVAFFRQGATLERLISPHPRPLQGMDIPDGPPDIDWGWPGYEFAIPRDWRTGVYLAVLIEIAADGRESSPDTTTTFATEAKALFVLRHAGPIAAGTPLYKLSWATFVAYNGTGYGSLYTEAVWSREQPAPGFKVTWRRPGCGTGGLVMPGDSEDFYDTSSRRQTFEHWDAPFVRWLEAEGFAPHYCTDWDLHRDPALLRPYSLLLSTGHDEYWSDPMRAALDAHVARGGNIAFFSGNISGYRIHFTDDDTAFTCAKVIPPTKDPDRWTQDAWIQINPECRLTGVATAFGGGWWDGKRQTLGYTVQHAAHWIFKNTGLAEGAVFGDDDAFPLIGYEVDGAAFRRRNGHAIATGEKGTPRDFLILGIAELNQNWVASRANAAATMGLYVSPQGGIVFQAATTDWPILVPRNRHVGQITRNIVDRMRWPAARIVGPLPARAGRTLAAVGETVTFHIDTANFGYAADYICEWEIAGAHLIEADGLKARVQLPPAADFVTISAFAVKDGQPVGFGTRSLLPLTAEEALKLDMLINMREMVMAGEPSNPLVSPTHDPADLNWLIFSIRVPWIRERAERLQAAAAKLMGRRGDD
ncbi:MAG TPA: N,N-dimethylformamidase beta subunit family domain-containing protein [Acetobacteraceae bacterium]